MTKEKLFAGFILLSAASGTFGADTNIYSFTVEDIDGTSVSLSQYKGKALLIVNTASKCGFTYQYEGLEALYQKYQDKGLVILGFPTNDFLKQEPGTNGEIKEFCMVNYGVTFPMFAKITVKGKKKEPLYDYLISKKTNPEFGGKITWNFNKFLIDGTGNVVNRFDSKTEPGDSKIVTAVERVINGL